MSTMLLHVPSSIRIRRPDVFSRRFLSFFWYPVDIVIG